MLDDLKMIHERDAQDALGVVGKQAQQLAQEFELVNGLARGDIHNVVFAGMGGVAASAEMVRSWLALPVPLVIVRDYELPAFVGPKTLCVVASYSGNTEETLAALEQALEMNACVAVISHGGALVETATARQLPRIILPAVSQPRFATWYTVKALATVLEAGGLVQGRVVELEVQQDWWEGQLAAWRPDVATVRNQAKQLALELAGKSVVVYTGSKLAPVAYKWKIALNENAKQVAWCNSYPEFNHNEFMGWTKQPVAKPYAVVDIRSSLERPQIQKRFAVSERLLSGVRPAPLVVQPVGESLLQQLLWASGLSDFVSIYAALLAGINPTPAGIVDKLKKELA